MHFCRMSGRTFLLTRRPEFATTQRMEIENESNRRLVVGLGNPGRKYESTRHIVGFDVVAELATRFFADAPRKKFEAEFTEVRIADQPVMLVAPQTYMNLSGRSVRQFADFFRIPHGNIVVICDDMNLDVGRLRWRAKGSAGGQNGLNNIIDHLGSQDFPRLRIGIGRPPGRMDSADYVLSRFRKEEAENIEHAKLRAADSIEVWIKEGVQAAMNQFNNDPNRE